MKSHISRTNAALETAIARYHELMGKRFPAVLRVYVQNDLEFWAAAECDACDLVIRLGGGVTPTLCQLWGDALTEQSFVDRGVRPLAANDKEAVHISLVWLFLHEMMHYELGHFDLVGRNYPTETDLSLQFALVSRAIPTPETGKVLDIRHRSKIEPCLELQADHDAIEILLDAYSTDGWDTIRARTAAISAMIVLIECEDTTRDHELSSHPKAATRIFQLLGHVMEMPMIPAHMKAINAGSERIDPDDLPSEEEQSAFNQQVVIPAFFDAVHLARIAGAETIASDLGDTAQFFGDIQIVKLGSVAAFNDLQTIGARQWAGLISVNEALKERLQR